MNRRNKRNNQSELETKLLDYARRVVKLELTIEKKKETPPEEQTPEAIAEWNADMQRLLRQREKIGDVYDELFSLSNQLSGGMLGEKVEKLIETHHADSVSNDSPGSTGVHQDLQPAGLYAPEELLRGPLYPEPSS